MAAVYFTPRMGHEGSIFNFLLHSLGMGQHRRNIFNRLTKNCFYINLVHIFFIMVKQMLYLITNYLYKKLIWFLSITL